jgi:ankyrin repeat protein
LHWAARLGRVQMVKLLIQYGADVQARGRDGLPVDVAAPVDGIKKLLSQNSLMHGLPSPVSSSPESPSVLKEKLPDFSRMESHRAGENSMKTREIIN